MQLQVYIDTKLDTKILDGLVSRMPNIGDDVVLDGAKKGAELVRRGIDMQRPEWPPLSAATIQRKGHDIIMIDTQQFYNSISAEKAGSRQAIYFTDIDYMPIHEFGLLEPDVPRRASFGPTVEGRDLQEITETITTSFMTKINSLLL